MRFSIASIISVVALASAAALPRTTTEPVLTPFFTGTIDLGKPLSPIVVPGGVRIVEPIVGGKITGPFFNATVLGGAAYPTVTNNGTVQNAEILIYGITSDKQSFLVQESGVGSAESQYTRINLEIGGKYANFSNDYILASVTPNAARTVVTVHSYRVHNKN